MNQRQRATPKTKSPKPGDGLGLQCPVRVLFCLAPTGSFPGYRRSLRFVGSGNTLLGQEECGCRFTWWNVICQG